MRRAVLAAVVVLATAHVAHADLRTAFGNDFFTDPVPPIPDDGLTNDIGVAFWRQHHSYLLGGSLFDRWVTEAGGFRRWDQVDLVATIEQPWPPYVTVSARLGPTVGGNWGGMWMQTHWHSIYGDRTVGHGLQDTYPGDRTVGVIAGGKVRVSYGRTLQDYAVVDAQLALGETGITYLEGALGTQVVHRFGRVELAAHLELADATYHTRDRNLTIPGGYGIHGWEPAWRVGAHVAWRRIKVEFEYRDNEGGSHEPIGVLAVTVREAGLSY